MRIAINAICKNEISIIDRFFEKHSEADYICILDTGSTDGTWEKLNEYSQTYPNKVIISQIIFSFFRFDEAKNEALKLVPKDADFIFALNIDECLEENWYSCFQKMYDGKSYQVGFRQKEYEEGYLVRDSFVPCGLKNDGGWHWKYAVHEIPKRIDLTKPIGIQNISDIVIIHTPKCSNSKNVEDNIKKNQFYMELTHLRYKEDPDDINNLLLEMYTLLQTEEQPEELNKIIVKLYSEHLDDIKTSPDLIKLLVASVYISNNFHPLEVNLLKIFLNYLLLQDPPIDEKRKIKALFLYFEECAFMEVLKDYYYTRDKTSLLIYLKYNNNLFKEYKNKILKKEIHFLNSRVSICLVDNIDGGKDAKAERISDRNYKISFTGKISIPVVIHELWHIYLDALSSFEEDITCKDLSTEIYAYEFENLVRDVLKGLEIIND